MLPQGIRTYEFNFNLKPELPSSFSGGSGKIKYKMEFVVDRKWKFDEKQTLVLNIVQTVNLNYILGTSQPFENQLTRNIGYIDSGPISLHVYVPKVGYIANEKIPVQVIVSNNSRTHVDKIKFALNKIIDYHSKTPGMAIKREIHRLLKKEAGGVSKKTEQRYEHVIDVPNTIPTQNRQTSRLIHITYELKVEAKIGGLHKNLIIPIPITIGNIVHSSTSQIPSIHLTELPAFPELPDLPAGLTVRSPPVNIDLDRMSMISNSSHQRFLSNLSQNPSLISSQSSANPSIASIPIDSQSTNDTASLNFNPQPTTSTLNTSREFHPTAPPFDVTTANLNCPSAQLNTSYLDAPPSYDEVFGSPSSLNHTNFSNSSSLHNASAAKT